MSEPDDILRRIIREREATIRKLENQNIYSRKERAFSIGIWSAFLNNILPMFSLMGGLLSFEKYRGFGGCIFVLYIYAGIFTCDAIVANKEANHKITFGIWIYSAMSYVVAILAVAIHIFVQE